MHTRLHANTHTYPHIYTHTHTYTHIYTHTYIYTHIHTQTDIYTHLYTHTDIYTRTHIHKHLNYTIKNFLKKNWNNSVKIQIIIILLLTRFSHQCSLVVIHWSPSDSKSPQVLSQYSGRSQQCYTLNGLDLSPDLRILQSFMLAFSDRFKCTNYRWYHYPPHIAQHF